MTSKQVKLSRLDREDFACSLRMMLSEGRCTKGKERVRIFIYFLKNPVDLLKSLVATAYVDCMAYAPCPVSDFV